MFWGDLWNWFNPQGVLEGTFWYPHLHEAHRQSMEGSVFHNHTVNLEETVAWVSCWRDFEGFEDEPVSVVEDIVSLGKSIGLDVDDVMMSRSSWKPTTLIWPLRNSQTFRGSSKRRHLQGSLQRKRRKGRIFLLHWSRKYFGHGEKCKVLLRNITLTKK